VMRSREDDIGKYKDKYEESMNPFEAFKGRVSVVGMSYGDPPLDPLGPEIGIELDPPSRYDCMYRTFSYSFRLSAWSDLISARKSDILSNCFRSSYRLASSSQWVL
jgi:hypothetical protein